MMDSYEYIVESKVLDLLDRLDSRRLRSLFGSDDLDDIIDNYGYEEMQEMLLGEGEEYY